MNSTTMSTDGIVLVTGGGGFIGGHLVASLIADGYQVRSVDIKPFDEWYQRHPEADNRVLDVSLLPDAMSAVEGTRYVFNLAADMGGMGFIENNKALCMLSVLTSTHVLMAAHDHGVERLFYSSSACVYAADKQTNPEITALVEADAYPAMPEDGYGWEKLFSERMAHHFYEDYGLETRVARYHNVYGPNGTYDGGREKAPAAISRKVALAKLTGDHTIDIWGDGLQTRSLHVHRRLRLRHPHAPRVRHPRAAQRRVERARHHQRPRRYDREDRRRVAQAHPRPQRPAGCPRPQQRQHPHPRAGRLGAEHQPAGGYGAHLRLGVRPARRPRVLIDRVLDPPSPHRSGGVGGADQEPLTWPRKCVLEVSGVYGR
ncbi:MAG: NAD-dependent epimerase/dehydratase family protein [Microthrixaceae bacterium]